MKNRFQTVKIIHNILQRLDFSYLAEFFRFMGILVCEEVLTEQNESNNQNTRIEQDTGCDAWIFVGKRTLGNEEAEALHISVEEYGQLVKNLSKGTIHVCEYLPRRAPGRAVVQDGYPAEEALIYLTKRDQKSFMMKFLDGLLGTVFRPGDTDGFAGTQLDKLIDIYVEKEIWRHSLNMQYYARRRSRAIEEAEKGFLAAQEAVKDVLESKKDQNVQYLYEYAMLWCQVKANNACSYCDEILYFSLEKLAGRCRELCEKFPEFGNAHVLLGLCYEPSSGSANEAVAAFMEALEKMGTACFTSAVYYWIGKRYERFSDKRTQAEENYLLANQRREKFRNIFKLAMAARDKGEAEKALELFERIPDKLAVKRGMKFTDPLELEYLYKTYFHQAHICYLKEDYARAIQYGVKCTDVWEKEMEESRYFEALYGKDDADYYRKVLRDRMDVSKEYLILADCYAKVFSKERAEACRARAKDLKHEEKE